MAVHSFKRFWEEACWSVVTGSQKSLVTFNDSELSTDAEN
jgi:hypothetical protein